MNNDADSNDKNIDLPVSQATAELAARSEELKSLQAELKAATDRADEVREELSGVREELEKHSVNQQTNKSLQVRLVKHVWAKGKRYSSSSGLHLLFFKDFLR